MANCAICPAARRIQGTTRIPHTLCGVLDLANDVHEGDGRSKRRGRVEATFGDDTAQVRLVCRGPGVPGSELSYTNCDLWQQAKHREWLARQLRRSDALVGGERPMRRGQFVELGEVDPRTVGGVHA